MSENKATVETVMAFEAGFKDGYEKGLRDMWEEMEKLLKAVVK